MVPFDVISLYTNNTLIDALNIIKDCINNGDQFARKTAIPQAKYLDLVNLVLTTTWYNFILIFTNKLMAWQWEVQYLQTQQKLKCRLMNIPQYQQHYTIQTFGNDLLMTFILLLNVRTLKTFSITLTI